MSNYAIMRFAKYKVGSVANIERHQNYRKKLKNRAHPEREKENHTWKLYNETMTKTVKSAIKKQEENTGRKVRKDANVICELVLTFSPEMEDKVPLNEWIKANFNWVIKVFGNEKMLRADLNRDERTTHLHCFVLMTNEQGIFNSSRFFNKKKQIVELQDSYAYAMKQFGLIRGESKEKTGAKHQSLHEWHKSECQRLEKELAEMADIILNDEQEFKQNDIVGDNLFEDLR